MQKSCGGRDRRPETRRMRSTKVALFKITMDSVQYNIEHCGINDERMMSTAFMCSRKFSRVQVLVNEFLLFRTIYISLPFLTQFPQMKCHIQGQGFANKIYISELFTVVGYLHTADLKKNRGTFMPSVYCVKTYVNHLSLLTVMQDFN